MDLKRSRRAEIPARRLLSNLIVFSRFTLRPYRLLPGLLQRRQHPQPVDVDVPATVPLGCVQVQVQVQVGFVVEVPPTEPVVCLQQGLQHRC